LSQSQNIFIRQVIEERSVPPLKLRDISVELKGDLVPLLNDLRLDLVLLRSKDVVEVLYLLLNLLAVLERLVRSLFKELKTQDGPASPLLAAADD
jgi:hypothetical protein